MKQTFIGAFFFSLLSTLLVAAELPKDIELEADDIGYYKNDDTLSASGNVVLSYQDYDVHAQYLEFDSLNRIVFFPDSVVFKTVSQNIELSKLVYDFNVGYGSAMGLHSHIRQLIIKSEDVTFELNRILLSNARFTSCDSDHEHYYMSAKHIEVYPHEGYFIAKQNRFYFKYLPFEIPVPYYVYGAKQEALIGSSSVFPEIGGNDVEGTYAKYSSSYLFNERFSGSGELGYSTKLEWNAGLGALYSLSDKIHIGSRYRYFFEDDIESAYIVGRYKHVFQNDEREGINLFDEMLARFSDNADLPTFEFLASYKHNQIENNYWVSRKPELEAKLKNIHFADYFDWHSTISLTELEEFRANHFYSDRKFMLNNTLTYSRPLSDRVDAAVSLTNYAYHYDKTGIWNRLFNTYTLSYKSFLNPRITYIKQLNNDGRTYFNFESQYALTSDEIGLSISQRFHRFEFNQNLFYTIETEDIRQLDVSIDMLFHCWSFGFRWGFQPNVFELRFSLL